MFNKDTTMSASCQGGEKGKKAVGNASKNHPLARAKQRRSNVQDRTRSRIVHERTHGLRTDRSIGRTSIHRAATATAIAHESDCAGAPPYDVRPRCTTRRACRYLLIGRWWSGSEAARRNDVTVRFFSQAAGAWRWLGACRGGGRPVAAKASA